MAGSKRDQLLDVAIELFFKNGCHTTGIDTLLARAGVAKMTLYAHFKSKEELILAAAERLHERQMAQLREVISDAAKSPLERLHAVFDDLHAFVSCVDFAGCPFHNVAAEFGDLHHPIHQMAARHKREVEEELVTALVRDGIGEPRALARQLMVLTDGAKSLVQITGDLGYVEAARSAGERLLAGALASSA